MVWFLFKNDFIYLQIDNIRITYEYHTMSYKFDCVIVARICKYLEPYDIGNMAKVSKGFHYGTLDQALWLYIIYRDFGEEHLKETFNYPDYKWRDVYIDLYTKGCYFTLVDQKNVTSIIEDKNSMNNSMNNIGLINSHNFSDQITRRVDIDPVIPVLLITRKKMSDRTSTYRKIFSKLKYAAQIPYCENQTEDVLTLSYIDNNLTTKYILLMSEEYKRINFYGSHDGNIYKVK